jgi:hypothetical protein
VKRALLAAALAVSLAWLIFGTEAHFPAERIGTRTWSGDFLSYYLPDAEHLGLRLARGELPLWDVRHGAGAPFLASLQVGALYPPNLLHAALPAQSAFVALLALHVALAVAGAGALAAALGANAFGAALAGIVYATSLRVLGEAWSPPLLYASAWAPALFFCVERSLARPGARSGTALAAAFALSLLTGWPYGAAIAALGAGLYAGVRLAWLAVSLRRPPLAASATLALGTLCGALLAAPQLLPAQELLAESCRALGSIDPEQAIFVGGPHDPQAFARELLRRGMNDGVPGALALLLAPLVFLRGPHREKIAALLAVGVFGLLASFAHHAPVYGWLRELPVLGDFRFPFRYRLLTTLALAVAAGIGATRLHARCAGRPALASAVALALLALQVATATGPVLRALAPFPRRPPPAALLADALRAHGLDPGDGRILRAGWSGKLRGADAARVVNDLEPLSLARTAQLLTFFESGRPLTVSRTTGPHVPLGSDADSLAAPYYGRIGLPDTDARGVILDLFSVAWVTSPSPPAWLAHRDALLELAGAPAFANPAALPRARWVPAAEREPRGLQATTARLVAPDFDARRTVLLDEPPPALTSPDALAGATGRVEITHDAPERIRLTSAAATPGVVVLSDAWFPGWEAQVDGAAAPLLRANLAFRAVAVPAGEHEIELRYRPRPLRVGTALAASGALACAAALGWGRVNRARSSPAR